MKHLVLSGGGDFDQTWQVDRFFFSLLPKQPEILYVPVAWKDGRYADCHVWFSQLTKKHSVDHFTMWTELQGKSWKEMDAFDAVYLGGGNTFKLLSVLRESGFADLLQKFIASGKPVFGGSAGAIVLGKSISTAGFGMDADENSVGLTDMSGLNQIHEKAVQCHYLPSQKAEMTQWAETHRLPLVALGEGGGIYVTDNGIEAIGADVFFFEPSL